MLWKKAFLVCALLVTVQAEPQGVISGVLNTAGAVLNGAADVLTAVARGFLLGTSGSLAASGTITGGVNIGSIGLGGTATINSNLPVLNLLNNVVTSVTTALNSALTNIGSAAGSLLSNTLTTITNVLNNLLGGVNTNLANIGNVLSSAPTVANGNVAINSLNNVVSSVNGAVNAVLNAVGTSPLASALSTLPAVLNADLANATQAIQTAVANPGTATTLLAALGPNGVDAVSKLLADAAGVLYATANIPMLLSADAGVNATLAANAGVPYSASGVAAVNASVNAAINSANRVLNSAVASFNKLNAVVQPATNNALAAAKSTVNGALSTLNTLFNLVGQTTRQSVTTAAQQAVANLTSLVSSVQKDVADLNNITLNAVAAANTSISATAASVIQPLVNNLASTNATIVACAQANLPAAVRTNVFYTTALGGCVVQVTTVVDILLGNTIAVLQSAANRISTSTISVNGCITLFPASGCATVTVPNAVSAIALVGADVVKIKTNEVLQVGNAGNQVADCSVKAATDATAAFSDIVNSYNACIGA